MSACVIPSVKSFVRVMFLCLWASLLFAQGRPQNSDAALIAHEWGTFTSIAGSDGQAVEWLPLNGALASDLPDFVEHNWGLIKQQLPATVRMETPVLYFYSSHAVNLSVQVSLSKGLMTEWFPHAVTKAPEGGDELTLYRKHALDGNISWQSVMLQPGAPADFPHDSTKAAIKSGVLKPESPSLANRYYAARQTGAAPLLVHAPSGDQHERFLFYRGVSEFAVPMSASFTGAGNLRVRNSSSEGVSNLIWFEHRGDHVGYQVHQELEGQTEIIMDPPALTSTIEHLESDLEEMLVGGGLYRDEAQAMIATWHDAWFEEGSRLFYIVPANFVDSVLPLAITPAPAQVVRVFVGRLELISPATQQTIAAALATNDQTTLQKYGRFLEPIVKLIKESNPTVARQIPPDTPPCAVNDGKAVVPSQKH